MEGHRSTFLGQKHKSAIWNRTPPTYTSNLIYMYAGGFRGPKSSNRIELSQLVPELLNFGVSGSLQLWGVGGRGWMDGGGGWLGVPPTHVCMHMHTCIHTHAYACVVNMIISCKWLPPLDLGKSRGFLMMSYMHAHVCMHMHACACV